MKRDKEASHFDPIETIIRARTICTNFGDFWKSFWQSLNKCENLAFLAEAKVLNMSLSKNDRQNQIHLGVPKQVPWEGSVILVIATEMHPKHCCPYKQDICYTLLLMLFEHFLMKNVLTSKKNSCKKCLRDYRWCGTLIVVWGYFLEEKIFLVFLIVMRTFWLFTCCRNEIPCLLKADISTSWLNKLKNLKFFLHFCWYA